MTAATEIPGFVKANDLDVYVERVGHGPDVLLIGGLGDTVESWQARRPARSSGRLPQP